jgi:DNA polymerase II large subunit
VCELDFQDIIIPRKGAEYLVKTAQFIDELLIKYYGEPPFYKLSKMEDLVGCLIIGLAPHTICGIFGRIIGITESQVCYAHPVWHSAKRRDCFSPETVITIKNLEDGIRNVRIKELVEEQFKRSKPQVIDDVGTEAVPGDGLKAATFNWQTDEIEFQPISQYLKGKMGRMMVAFSTKSGRTAHVTPYHKALVLKDGEWQKIKAVEIENETILPTAFSIRATPKYHCEEKLDLYGELLKLPSTNAFVIRNIKFFLKQILREHNSGKQWRYLTKMAQQLQIPPNQLNHWINRGSVPIEVMAKILSLTGAKTLPEEATIGVKYNIVTIPHLVDQIKLARFLGLITAEGWLREKYGINQTAFRNTASQILKEFDQLVFDLFKLKPYAPPNERDKRYICSKVIIALLRLWGCGRTSHEKRVPTIILNGDRKIQLNFLATYLEGDGNAHPEVGISFYTSSEMLQYDLSLLLSTMDIYCTFYVDNDRMGKTLVANYKKLGIPAPQLKVYRINISSFNAAKLAKLLYPLAITKKAPLKIIAAKTVFHPSYKMGQTVFLDPVKDHISTVQAQSEDYCIDVPPDHTVLINGGLIMANCDGDEDGLMLALDCLINFSKFYLSEQIGGIMDAPLMLSSFINLDEVQRQALEVDVAKSYPLEFYQATFLHDTPRKFAEKIKVIDSLRREKTHAEFTVPTSDINRGNQITLYSRLPSMAEKIEAQFDIMERLAGVDVREVALNVLNTHFMKDIIGNLRAFTTQTFRCKSCNKKYRRPPLSGKCLQCNGELAQTVYRGGIEKYLDQAEMLITKYNLPSYYYQRIQLVKSELDLLFGKEEEKKSPFKQGTLADFV